MCDSLELVRFGCVDSSCDSLELILMPMHAFIMWQVLINVVCFPQTTPPVVPRAHKKTAFFAGDGPLEWVRPIPKAPERSWHASGPSFSPNGRFWTRFGSFLMIWARTDILDLQDQARDWRGGPGPAHNPWLHYQGLCIDRLSQTLESSRLLSQPP